MDATEVLATCIKEQSPVIGKVIDFAPGDQLYKLNFTASNTQLTNQITADTLLFSNWINKQLAKYNARYGIGGYMEHRTIYDRSTLFDTGDEARRLHLGVDIWAAAGTPVYAPLQAKIHSFRDNNNFGDYGPTIILQHSISKFKFYSLYGHLSRSSITHLKVGQLIQRNEQIGQFGNEVENGNWPPHLHFQLILNVDGFTGDYPGVCKFSDKEKYLQNIPDPDLILKFDY